MGNPFTAHPQSVNESYWEHFAFAARFGFKMVLGGFAALLHAIFPFMFVTTAGKLCDELQRMRLNSPGRLKVSELAASSHPPTGNPR
ncbi:MAG: DUF6356 family protein [Betaproteobacteria bacterium]